MRQNFKTFVVVFGSILPHPLVPCTSVTRMVQPQSVTEAWVRLPHFSTSTGPQSPGLLLRISMIQSCGSMRVLADGVFSTARLYRLHTHGRCLGRRLLHQFVGVAAAEVHDAEGALHAPGDGRAAIAVTLLTRSPRRRARAEDERRPRGRLPRKLCPGLRAAARGRDGRPANLRDEDKATGQEQRLWSISIHNICIHVHIPSISTCVTHVLHLSWIDACVIQTHNRNLSGRCFGVLSSLSLSLSLSLYIYIYV